MSSEHFGRYIIKSEIGRGGMATVILAADPRFERDVAIKVLPREFLHDAQFRTRFEREAKTIALLEHPAIVPVYDFGEEDGQPYIVMRFMSGGSLSDRVKQGPLSPDEVVQIFNRLAPALDAAHAKGIIHRDLKPANILFDQYGNAFLSDFGIARLAQTTGATLTGGNILGTPAYMSPEQIQGDKEIDGRSDIYAMGVILYQLLSGNAPYQATTPARVMMMHILEPIPDIRQEIPNMPMGIEAVIDKSMAKEPEERFQSMTDMAASLSATMTQPITPPQGIPMDKTLISDGRTAVRPVRRQVQKTEIAPRESIPVPEKKRSFLPLILIALALIGAVVVLGGGGYLYFQNSANTRATQDAAKIALVEPTEPTHTASPTDTEDGAARASATQESKPTDTLEVPTGPTPTLEATLTDTPEPTLTNTPEPDAPVLGGSNMVAFLSNRDVWVANLDGSGLKRLTNDSAEKTRLQWLPDGDGLLYIQGKCVKTIMLDGSVEVITCFDTVTYFEDFAVSPDGSKVAITLDHEQLYIVPFDKEQLSQVRFRRDLVPLGECQFFSPYGSYQFKDVQWSKDGEKLAMVIGTPLGGLINDIIEVRNFSQCSEIPPRETVQFPANFFTIKGYGRQPYLLSFGWDGQTLFALTGIVRNEGFGDLYIFNSDSNRADLEVNPVGGNCCYRDPSWSPDGRYLTFAYQQFSTLNDIDLYVVPYGSIGTGEIFSPLPLPDDLFPDRAESPQPILRPSQ